MKIITVKDDFFYSISIGIVCPFQLASRFYHRIYNILAVLIKSFNEILALSRRKRLFSHCSYPGADHSPAEQVIRKWSWFYLRKYTSWDLSPLPTLPNLATIVVNSWQLCEFLTSARKQADAAAMWLRVDFHEVTETREFI